MAAPAPAAVEASESEPENAGEAVLPEKSSKPKKVLNFRNHFSEGILRCRPWCDYSDDDDEESTLIKDQGMLHVTSK